MSVIPKRYDPSTIRWSGGRMTVDDPDTGQRVPINSLPGQAAPVAPVDPLPAAAQIVLDQNPDLTRAGGAISERHSCDPLDWASKKRGPPYTDLGQAVKYPLAALVDWKAQQMKNATPAAAEPEPVKRGRGRPPRVSI